MRAKKKSQLIFRAPGKTFETVDGKTEETEFFLRQMYSAGFNQKEFNWYFSAFLSAARTTTLALQKFRGEIPGFEKWYAPHSKRLAESDIAKFYLDMRNDHMHGGAYLVSRGEILGNTTKFFFAESVAPQDVLTLSRQYFLMLLEIVYDCYQTLGVYIDSQQYLTKEHFAATGKTIEDAEIEVWGFIRTSLIEEGYSEDDRWDELRTHGDECEINHLFYSYLGRVTPQPKVPEHFDDFEFTPEEKGWLHIPAGYQSLAAYRSEMGLPNSDDL